MAIEITGLLIKFAEEGFESMARKLEAMTVKTEDAEVATEGFEQSAKSVNQRLSEMTTEANDAVEAMSELATDGNGAAGAMGELARESGEVIGQLSIFGAEVEVSAGAVRSLAAGLRAIPWAAVIKGAVEFVQVIAKVGDEAVIATARMDAVFKGRGKEMREMARQFALDSPLNKGQVENLVVSLGSMGLEPTIDLLDDIVDIGAATGDVLGGTAKAADALGLAFQQGNLNIDTMNKLVNAGIPAYDIMAESLGVTQAQLHKLIREQKLGRDDIIGFTQALGEHFEGAADGFTKTVAHQMERLDALMGEFWEDLSNPSEGAHEAIVEFGQLLNRLADQAIQAYTGSVSGGLGMITETVLNFVTATLSLFTETIPTTISNFLIAAFNNTKASILEIVAFLYDSWETFVGWFAGQMGTMADAVGQMASHGGPFAGRLTAMATGLQEFADKFAAPAEGMEKAGDSFRRGAEKARENATWALEEMEAAAVAYVDLYSRLEDLDGKVTESAETAANATNAIELTKLEELQNILAEMGLDSTQLKNFDDYVALAKELGVSVDFLAQALGTWKPMKLLDASFVEESELFFRFMEVMGQTGLEPGHMTRNVGQGQFTGEAALGGVLGTFDRESEDARNERAAEYAKTLQDIADGGEAAALGVAEFNNEATDAGITMQGFMDEFDLKTALEDDLQEVSRIFEGVQHAGIATAGQIHKIFTELKITPETQMSWKQFQLLAAELGITTAELGEAMNIVGGETKEYDRWLKGLNKTLFDSRRLTDMFINEVADMFTESFDSLLDGGAMVDIEETMIDFFSNIAKSIARAFVTSLIEGIVNGIQEGQAAGGTEGVEGGGGGFFSAVGGALGIGPGMENQSTLQTLGQLGAGIGMMWAGNQQGGAGGAIQGAMGGAMAGAQIGFMAAGMTFGTSVIIGAIIGAIAGGLAGFFGGGDDTPSTRVSFGGEGNFRILGSSNQGLTGRETEAWRREMEATWKAMREGYIDLLRSFGDVSLFDMVLDGLGTQMDNFRDMTADDVAKWLTDVWMPDELQRQFHDAINAGLTGLGATRRMINELWSILRDLPAEERLEVLGEVVGAFHTINEILEFDWNELDRLATQSPWESFLEFLDSAGDEIDILTASWGEMDLSQRAGDMQAIGQIWSEVSQAFMDQLRAIRTLQDEVTAAFADLINSFNERAMSPEELWEHYRQEYARLMASLDEAETPEEAQRIINDIISLIGSIGGQIPDEMLNDKVPGMDITWLEWLTGITSDANELADAVLARIEEDLEAEFNLWYEQMQNMGLAFVGISGTVDDLAGGIVDLDAAVRGATSALEWLIAAVGGDPDYNPDTDPGNPQPGMKWCWRLGMWIPEEEWSMELCSRKPGLDPEIEMVSGASTNTETGGTTKSTTDDTTASDLAGIVGEHTGLWFDEFGNQITEAEAIATRQAELADEAQSAFLAMFADVAALHEEALMTVIAKLMEYLDLGKGPEFDDPTPPEWNPTPWEDWFRAAAEVVPQAVIPEDLGGKRVTNSLAVSESSRTSVNVSVNGSIATLKPYVQSTISEGPRARRTKRGPLN